jgi:hypothetical protein
MSRETIKLIKRNVYGRVLYYPDCPLSRSLVAVADQKTLTGTDLEKLKADFDLTIKEEA